MDSIERISRASGSGHWQAANFRERGRRWALRLEWLEDRVMLSGSPSISVINLTNSAETGRGNAGSLPYILSAANHQSNPAGNLVAPVEAIPPVAGPPTGDSGPAQQGGIYLAGGVVTIGGPMIPVSSPPLAGGTASATGSGSQNGTGTGSVSSAQGTSQMGQSSGSAAGTTASQSTTNNTNPATNATNATTSNTNPATTASSTSGSSGNNEGGGIPVATGQLTIVMTAVAGNSTQSVGVVAVQAPMPAIQEMFVTGFGISQAQAPGLALSDSFAPVSSIVSSQNARGTTAVAKAGDNLSASEGSLSALPSPIGTSGSGSVISGQNANPAGPANLISAASAANIGNPAPNTVFLKTNDVSSDPPTRTAESLQDAIESPASITTEAIDAPTPADVHGEVPLEGAAVPADHSAPVPLSDAILIDGATGSSDDLAETFGATLTLSESVLASIAPDGASAAERVGETIVFCSMLAAVSANLVFGGADSHYRTIARAARRWPGTSRVKSMPKVR